MPAGSVSGERRPCCLLGSSPRTGSSSHEGPRPSNEGPSLRPHLTMFTSLETPPPNTAMLGARLRHVNVRAPQTSTRRTWPPSAPQPTAPSCLKAPGAVVRGQGRAGRVLQAAPPPTRQVSEERAGGQRVGCLEHSPLAQQEGPPRAASACVFWNLLSEKSESQGAHPGHAREHSPSEHCCSRSEARAVGGECSHSWG